MKFLEKVWDTLGLYEYVETEDDDSAKAKTAEQQYRPSVKPVQTAYEESAVLKKTSGFSTNTSASASSNVVSLPVTNKQIKVMVVTPTVFDDSQIIADHIRGSKTVVVNFEATHLDIMKRIIDFISGTVYAVNGTIKLVGNNIMVCAPSNVDIDEKENFIADKDFSLWKQ